MKHDAHFDGRPIRLSVTTKQFCLGEAINERLNYVISVGRASVSLSYVTIAFNVARPFCLMDVAEF